MSAAGLLLGGALTGGFLAEAADAAAQTAH
jgi:hypothetical protein